MKFGFGKKQKQDDALRDDYTDTEQESADNVVTKAKLFYDKYLFDRHKKIERRIGYMVASIVIFIVGVGIGGLHYHHEQYIQSQQVTNFDDEVGFSKTTSATMTLNKLQLSKDKQTAYLPFVVGDMSELSSNAKNFKILASSTNGELKYKLTGKLVFFGSSGQGALVLHTSTKFDNQPLHIFIRNDKNLSEDDESQNESDIDSLDSSLIEQVEAKYDMVDFVINPGGTHAKVDDNLSSTVNAVNAYSQLFAQKQKNNIVKANKSNESKIKSDEARISEYKDRLKTAGFKLPNDPKWMANDWRPYDYIQNDGVPHNLAGKRTAEQQRQYMIDGKLPTSDDDDDPDSQQFPEILKRADGTTTDEVDNSSSSAQSGTDDGDVTTDDDSNTTTSSTSETPAEIWSKLQETWTDVKTLKRNIYSVNAALEKQIDAQTANQVKIASIGPDDQLKILNIGL